MRVLFTTPAELTHLQPIIPLAKALQAAGHDVAVAAPSTIHSVIASSELPVISAGVDHREIDIAELQHAPVGNERIYWNHRYMWRGSVFEQMVSDLLPIVRDWSPDLLVRDDFELGGLLVAEHYQIPHAVAGAVWFKAADFEDRVDWRMPEVQSRLGLSLESIPAMAYRYLALPMMPPEWPAPHEIVPSTTRFLRPIPFTFTDEGAQPDWLADLSRQPVVHVTLGTVFNRTPGLYNAIITGLRDEPVNLVVTVGHNQDPADFGPLPSHVRVERFVPHRWLLPACDVVVTHGGYGTIMAALSHGLPLVVLPIMGDQFRNADRCVALDAGISISPQQRSPEAVRDAVTKILEDRRYRDAALALRDRMQLLPGPEHGVTMLEQLARTRQPIIEG